MWSLMPVGNHRAPDFIPVFLHKGKIRDHTVHAQHFLVGKRQPTVHNHHVILTFVQGEVFSDLVEAAQKIGLDGGFRGFFFLPCAPAPLCRLPGRAAASAACLITCACWAAAIGAVPMLLRLPRCCLPLPPSGFLSALPLAPLFPVLLLFRLRLRLIRLAALLLTGLASLLRRLLFLQAFGRLFPPVSFSVRKSCRPGEHPPRRSRAGPPASLRFSKEGVRRVLLFFFFILCHKKFLLKS